MRLVQYLAPTIEPVSLADIKEHLGLDSGTLADNTALYSCIAPGSHAVTVGYTLLGTAIEVLGKRAVVYLQPVNNGTGATVDCKIQESDDNATWTDWTTGAFTRITEANDTTQQEKEYTGSKRYIRTAANPLVAASEFSTSIMVYSSLATLDTYLSTLITSARMDVESDSRRQIMTATWDYYPQSWGCSDRIKLPKGNLQSVTSVKYKDTDGTETTLTVGTDYLVETNGNQCGFIVLPYGCSWPADTLYPSNPISIRFICGYGATAESVPATIKHAIKLRCTKFFTSRGEDTIGQLVKLDETYDRLIEAIPRLYDVEFL